MPATQLDRTVDVTDQLMVFTIEEQRYAVRLPVVERVVRAVEITSLPKAPEIVLGVINAQGRIIPVVNMRRRFRLPEREIDPSDHIVIARTARRTVALIVDTVSHVVPCTDAQVVASETILPGLEHVEGVLKLPEGMILIHDLDRFLSLEEEHVLEEAMKPGEPSP